MTDKLKQFINMNMEFLMPNISMRIKKERVKSKRKEEYELIKVNQKYKNIHQGQRCFLIGNGPSLKSVDFSKLKNEITFTANQISRMPQYSNLYNNYHIWVDERFFTADLSTPEGKELVNVMRAVNTADNCPKIFYKTKAKKMIEENQLDKSLDISYLMDGYEFFSSKIDLSIDLPLPVFSTCIHYLIVLAVYMGFSEIYLLGCDCTSILNVIRARMITTEQMEYAYQCSENEIKRMRKQQEESSLEDELLWASYMFKTYRLLYYYCNSQGVKLFNATEGSLLEDIPKVMLKDVLQEKEK